MSLPFGLLLLIRLSKRPSPRRLKRLGYHIFAALTGRLPLLHHLLSRHGHERVLDHHQRVYLESMPVEDEVAGGLELLAHESRVARAVVRYEHLDVVLWVD